MSSSDPVAAIQHLIDVMTRLLGPEGCPWDRAQTHRSLVPYLLEEAYELAETIEAPHNGTDAGRAMAEELGDVLLQVVLHAKLAEQAGAFTLGDVAERLTAKMIERHPHVFGQERLASADQVSDAWERRKSKTRASRLDGIPAALPALMRAQKVGSRAAKAGFEWPSTGDILAKAHEELAEFEAAFKSRNTGARSPDAASRDAAELELGDLLFALVQLARWSGIDAERGLQRSTNKFASRFRQMEAALAADRTDPVSLEAEAWWELWDRAKAEGSAIDTAEQGAKGVERAPALSNEVASNAPRRR